MKIPQIFIPSKNLEGKTGELLKEEMKADLNNERYRLGLENLLSDVKESTYFPTLIDNIAKLPKLLRAVDFLLDKGQNQYRFSVFSPNSVRFLEQFEDVLKISDKLNSNSDLGELCLIHKRELLSEESVFYSAINYARNYLDILKSVMKFALNQQIDPSRFYYKLESLYNILFPKIKIKRESKATPEDMRKRLALAPFLDGAYDEGFAQGLRLLKHFYDYGCNPMLYYLEGGFVQCDPIEYLLECLPKGFCRDWFRQALQTPATKNKN
ncbi:MAG: hypothetical protein Q8N77_06355 [Nanoarchaeota archaeon]|nr:hypothetical protein [Nanoarchaeota archaeon]